MKKNVKHISLCSQMLLVFSVFTQCSLLLENFHSLLSLNYIKKTLIIDFFMFYLSLSVS